MAVTARKPTEAETRDLRFAWRVTRHVIVERDRHRARGTHAGIRRGPVLARGRRAGWRSSSGALGARREGRRALLGRLLPVSGLGRDGGQGRITAIAPGPEVRAGRGVGSRPPRPRRIHDAYRRKVLPALSHELLLILTTDRQFTQLIARRAPGAGRLREIVDPRLTRAQIEKRAPKGLVLSGGPSRARAGGARPSTGNPRPGIPVLGICYGFQLLAATSAAAWPRATRREYREDTLA